MQENKENIEDIPIEEFENDNQDIQEEYLNLFRKEKETGEVSKEKEDDKEQ